jgi:hypothetical protein
MEARLVGFRRPELVILVVTETLRSIADGLDADTSDE